jgi:hypothetical protein
MIRSARCAAMAASFLLAGGAHAALAGLDAVSQGAPGAACTFPATTINGEAGPKLPAAIVAAVMEVLDKQK